MSESNNLIYLTEDKELTKEILVEGSGEAYP
jgi:hypothetical protein